MRRTEKGIFVYGSLLHPEELKQTFPHAHDDAFPIWIDGYRRHFNQRSTFREGDDGERAVLNLEEAPNERVNGVLVPNISTDAYSDYTDRESGYEVVKLPSEKITPYQDDDTVDSEVVMTAIGNRRLSDPSPIPSYTALVLEGALLWGEDFATDFLITTERL